MVDAAAVGGVAAGYGHHLRGRLQECADLRAHGRSAEDLDEHRQCQPLLGGDQSYLRARSGPDRGPGEPASGLVDGAALSIARGPRLGKRGKPAQRGIPETVRDPGTCRIAGVCAVALSAHTGDRRVDAGRRQGGAAACHAGPGGQRPAGRGRHHCIGVCRTQQPHPGTPGSAGAGRAHQEFPVPAPVRHHQYLVRAFVLRGAAVRPGGPVRSDRTKRRRIHAWPDGMAGGAFQRDHLVDLHLA
ncbi:hypothetical protein G6F35_014666 [Rhizopus arrhizus]|nr:hypothetical protein G6F35_014666 [Rhizopus arrhizus]